MTSLFSLKKGNITRLITIATILIALHVNVAKAATSTGCNCVNGVLYTSPTAPGSTIYNMNPWILSPKNYPSQSPAMCYIDTKASCTLTGVYTSPGSCTLYTYSTTSAADCNVPLDGYTEILVLASLIALFGVYSLKAKAIL